MTLESRRERAEQAILDAEKVIPLPMHKLIMRHNAGVAAVRALWVSRRKWRAVAEQQAARIAELEGVADAAAKFINERTEYVNVLRGCTEANEDYYRWQGGAEARRQLAQKLGWTVPYEHGDKTAKVVADPETELGVLLAQDSEGGAQ